MGQWGGSLARWGGRVCPKGRPQRGHHVESCSARSASRDRRCGAPQDSLSVPARRPEAVVLPRLGMDAVWGRARPTSRRQQQDAVRCPGSPGVRGRSLRCRLLGRDAQKGLPRWLLGACPLPRPPLPGWPWRWSQGACRRRSLARTAPPLHARWPAGVGVCCCEYGQAGVHGGVHEARGIPPILTSLDVEPRASGGGQWAAGVPLGPDGSLSLMAAVTMTAMTLPPIAGLPSARTGATFRQMAACRIHSGDTSACRPWAGMSTAPSTVLTPPTRGGPQSLHTELTAPLGWGPGWGYSRPPVLGTQGPPNCLH